MEILPRLAEATRAVFVEFALVRSGGSVPPTRAGAAEVPGGVRCAEPFPADSLRPTMTPAARPIASVTSGMTARFIVLSGLTGT
jgi:hypothetical protein